MKIILRIDVRAYRKNTGKQKILCEDLPVPSELKNIIKKATEEEVNLRYQSMTNLLLDLEKLIIK